MALEISSSTLKSTVSKHPSLKDLREQATESMKEVDKIKHPISYQQFFTSYLLPNRPCILGEWVTEHWRSRQEWVTEEGKPHLRNLQEKFGGTTVPVANCNKEQYSSHPKEDHSIEDYMAYWSEYIQQGHQGQDCLYLKDWHFVRDYPEYGAYSTPVFFQSDWLNEFWDSIAEEDDYRFVYMGPKGSWTPFHADVFRSNSWSANICGCKQWILFAPGQEKWLQDTLGNLPFDLTAPEMENMKKYPNVGRVSKRFEVTQKAGEVIFVPSGWHHQVINLEDTISINHNWLNGCDVDISWNFIKANLAAVEHEIEDCRDMDDWASHCQLILKASSGINYKEYCRFMATVAKNRISLLMTDSRFPVTGTDGQKEKKHKKVSDKHKVSQSCNSTRERTGEEFAPCREGCGAHYIEAARQSACSQCDKVQRASSLDCNTKTKTASSQSVSSQKPLGSECAQTQLTSTEGAQKYKWYKPGRNHCLFDLIQVKIVLQDMMKNKQFQEIVTGNSVSPCPEKLLAEIETFISLFDGDIEPD